MKTTPPDLSHANLVNNTDWKHWLKTQENLSAPYLRLYRRPRKSWKPNKHCSTWRAFHWR